MWPRAATPGEDGEAFLNAGYTEEHGFGVIVAIGVLVFANYTIHLFGTDVVAAIASRN